MDIFGRQRLPFIQMENPKHYLVGLDVLRIEFEESWSSILKAATLPLEGMDCRRP